MIILFLLVIGVTLYIYSIKCLDAPISSGTRFLLTACRFVFLGVLLLLLTRPLIQETQRTSRSTSLFVALDDSLSMSYPIHPSEKDSVNPPPSRFETTMENLIDEGIQSDWQSRGFDIRYGLFSSFSQQNDTAWSAKIPEKASPEFNYTDISSVLDSFREQSNPEHSAYLLLFTDGQWNRGRNPVPAVSTIFAATSSDIDPIGHRVYSFGIGTTDNLFDVILDKVTLPSTARAGESLTLRAHLLTRGDILPEPLTIRFRGGLRDGGESFYQEQRITFTESQKELTVFVEIPPLTPGEYLFTTEIDPLEDELFQNNNQITEGVRVRTAQDPVLILTSAPDWELKFLKRVLENYEGIDPETYLVHENGLSYLDDRDWINRHLEETDETELTEQVYENLETLQYQIDRWSIIILHNFSFQNINPEFASTLREYIENGKGVLFIPGPLNSSQPSTNIREILPSPLVQVFTQVRQQVPVDINSSNVPEIRSAMSQYPDEDLPPLFPYYRTGAPLPGSQTLLQGFTTLEEPVNLIIQNRFGLGRIIILATNSFWKWRMLTGEDILVPFWLSLIYQANPNIQAPPGQLYTDGFVYDLNESVKVSYAAKDRIQESTVSGIPVTVDSPERKETLWLEPSETQLNMYEASYTPIDAGKYTLSTETNDAAATIEVRVSTLEINELSQNVNSLRGISQMGGGEYANEPAWKNLAKSLPSAKWVKEEQKTTFLGEKWWIFLTMIIFITLEWYIRRQHGLP